MRPAGPGRMMSGMGSDSLRRQRGQSWALPSAILGYARNPAEDKIPCFRGKMDWTEGSGAQFLTTLVGITISALMTPAASSLGPRFYTEAAPETQARNWRAFWRYVL